MFNNRQYLAAEYQHTLKDSIAVNGRGSHFALQVVMTLTPAETNSGYAFMGRDATSLRAELPAHWNNVVDPCLSTTVANTSGTGVGAIEYPLATLSVYGARNGCIISYAPEVTFMGGHAEPLAGFAN